MSDTPTPRTDAAWDAAPRADHGGMTAMANLARQLERELTKLLSDYQQLANNRDQLLREKSAIANSVLAWLGFWRDKMDSKAVTQLQEVLLTKEF